MTPNTKEGEAKTRYCNKCKEVKSLDMFNADRTKTLGREYVCRKCRSEYHRKIYTPRVTPTEEYREYRKKQYVKYRVRHPERTRAHTLAYKQRHILRKSTCERCGGVETLQMHHPDYSKPLEVITLCRKCHDVVHPPIPSRGSL